MLRAETIGTDGDHSGAWSLVDPALAEALAAEMARSRSEVATLRHEAELAAVLAFVRALEVRCAETAGHVDRIARSSETIAAAMGLCVAEIERIGLGGRLHDIGKVGVPDAILWKPGPLDEAEFAALAQHPLTGARMLAATGLPAGVRPIVRAHHERFDGTGYPDGLAGEEIPLGARIVAVADAFDAMTSDRPYRAALGRRQALARLRRARGSQLDPDVVDVFLDAQPRVARAGR